MRSPTRAAEVSERGPGDLGARIEFATTIPVRVVALRNEAGNVFLEHAYTDFGDVLPSLRPEQVSALFEKARNGFRADDVEAAAVEDAKHVGSL